MEFERYDWATGDWGTSASSDKPDLATREVAGNPTGEVGGLDAPGNASTSEVLAVGGAIDGVIDSLGDQDWARVTLTAGQSYLFTMTKQVAGSTTDPFLRLYDSNSSLITFNDDGASSNNAALRYTPTVSGTYFISASAYNDESTGGYHLTLAAVPPQDPLDTIDWGTQLTSTSVKVYFATTGQSFEGNTASRSWTLAEKSALFLAAQTWANVTNVTFTEVSSAALATMVLVLDPTIDAVGQMTLPPSLPNVGAFDPTGSWWTTGGALSPGGEAFQAMVHELGHALGLAHPHDDGGASQVMEGVTDEFDSYGVSGLNQGVYTVMSYNDGWPTGPSGGITSYGFGSEASPMALDIAVVQRKYGAHISHTGDDTYDLTAIGGTQYLAIWDSGGEDSIVDSSGHNVLIDLRAATLAVGVSPGQGGYLSYWTNFNSHGGYTIANGVTIENASSGSGNDHLIGNAVANHLSGGAGQDWLEGGAGDDVLSGDAGADKLQGGSGDDTYYVDVQGDVVIEAAGEGTADDVVASGNYYLYPNIEFLHLAMGAGAIFGVGNDDNNVIVGNESDNLIIAGGGSDNVTGGAGNDSIFGQSGGDNLLGQAGIDYIVGGDGDDSLDGGDGPDALYGEAGADNLNGGVGFFTDIMVGGDGDDIMNGASFLGDYDLMDGGAGNDTYYVDTPNDLTFEALGGGTDTVIANIVGAGYYLYANVENLTLQDHTPFGVGNELDNVLIGSEFANWLLGGAGDDTLDGKAGNDVLFGESGADTFVFEAGTGGDVIGDFQVGVDKIQLNSIYADFAQVQAAMHDVAGTTAIDLGHGDFIVLNGVAMTTIGAGDFLFA
jgi:serralysin